MNERIKELLNEAEKSVSFLSNSNESKHQIAMQRFAELIIKECADIATINSHQWHSAGRFVLTHFGVEE